MKKYRKMNMEKFLFILLLIVACLHNLEAQAEETYSFSLDEAKAYALENNKLIKNALYDVDASSKKTWQAISAGLPQAEIGMDYTNFFNYELEFQFGMSEDPNFTPQQLSDATSQTLDNYPGVTQQDLYNYAAGSYYERLLQEMMPPTTILMSDQMSAKLQVSQMIFSGQYIIGIQTAKLAEKMASQSLEKTRNDVKEIVSSAYFMALLSQESERIFNETYNNMKKVAKNTQAMLNVGMAEETDFKQIQITLSSLENRRKLIERSVEISYNTLKFQLGLNPNSEITLTDSLEEIIENIDLVNSLLIAYNYENNIDFRLMNSQEILSEKMVNMQKMSYLPTVFGFYNHNEKIITTDFDMNPKNLIGFNLSWPIFTSGDRNAKVQEAKIGLEKTRTNKEMVMNQLALQEKQSRYNLKNATENYSLQKENMRIAREVYESFERKYNNGIISSLDLTQASDNYLEAQNNYFTSIFDVLQSKLALDKLVNNL